MDKRQPQNVCRGVERCVIFKKYRQPLPPGWQNRYTLSLGRRAGREDGGRWRGEVRDSHNMYGTPASNSNSASLLYITKFLFYFFEKSNKDLPVLKYGSSGQQTR